MSNELSQAKVEVILPGGTRRRVSVSDLLEAAGFVRAVEGDLPSDPVSKPAAKKAAKTTPPPTTETVGKQASA